MNDSYRHKEFNNMRITKSQLRRIIKEELSEAADRTVNIGLGRFIRSWAEEKWSGTGRMMLVPPNTDRGGDTDYWRMIGGEGDNRFEIHIEERMDDSGEIKLPTRVTQFGTEAAPSPQTLEIMPAGNTQRAPNLLEPPTPNVDKSQQMTEMWFRILGNCLGEEESD